ncbi:MAG: RNA methyltransferase, partial [Firmicutes bacterium]|nr:RNA methyltransferase [Bacillota bacterium]
TLLRTAVACGFSDVYAVNCVDIYSPKVLRSAMSAHFCLNLRESNSLAEVFDKLDELQIVACDMNGGSVFDFEFGNKIALVLGNEGNGLSDYTKANADAIVSLPMANSFESLNVAVAGSVIMYRVFAKTLNK